MAVGIDQSKLSSPVAFFDKPQGLLQPKSELVYACLQSVDSTSQGYSPSIGFNGWGQLNWKFWYCINKTKDLGKRLGAGKLKRSLKLLKC